MPLVNLICAHEDTIVLNTKSNQKHKKNCHHCIQNWFHKKNQDSRFKYNEYSYCSLWDVLTFFTWGIFVVFSWPVSGEDHAESGKHVSFFPPWCNAQCYFISCSPKCCQDKRHLSSTQLWTFQSIVIIQLFVSLYIDTGCIIKCV